LPKKLPKIVKEIQKATPPPVNYAYQKGISFSQLTIFNNCPHRWKLQYKDRIKVFTSSIHTVFGTAMHEAIQKYLDVMYASSGAEADRLDLVEIFQEKFVGEYKAQYTSNNKQHFSSAEEMREFFDDGVEILNWLKKKRNKYFSRRGWYLVGCEIPIVIQPNKMYNNVLYNGFWLSTFNKMLSISLSENLILGELKVNLKSFASELIFPFKIVFVAIEISG